MSEIPIAHFDKDHYMNPHNIDYTDQQLQLALSKMLPEKLIFDNEYTTYGNPTPRVRWLYDSTKHLERSDLSVYDTEWLHVCWLVEETLTDAEMYNHIEHLYQINNKPKYDFHNDCHTTWQQRAIALAKVKGVEIV